MEPGKRYRIDLISHDRLQEMSDTLFLEAGTPYIRVSLDYETTDRNLPIGIKGAYVSLEKAISIELRCDNAIRVFC